MTMAYRSRGPDSRHLARGEAWMPPTRVPGACSAARRSQRSPHARRIPPFRLDQGQDEPGDVKHVFESADAVPGCRADVMAGFLLLGEWGRLV